MKLPFLKRRASTKTVLTDLGFMPKISAGNWRVHRSLKAYDVCPSAPFNPDVMYAVLGGMRYNAGFGDRLWTDYVHRLIGRR